MGSETCKVGFERDRRMGYWRGRQPLGGPLARENDGWVQGIIVDICPRARCTGGRVRPGRRSGGRTGSVG